MKKLLAILLAALMALTGTLALAEGGDIEEPVVEETAPAFPGLTLTCEFDVDREVLANALTTLGAPDAIKGIADNIAAVIDEAGERLIVVPEGMEYALTLKGKDLVNLVLQQLDEGIALGSSLIPSYVLTMSNETLGLLMDQMSQSMSGAMAGIDMEALSAALGDYSQQFIASCTAAVTYGTPEQGDYVMDGISYNTMIPINVDIPAIMEAMNTLTQQMKEDENVKAVLDALAAQGVNISLDEAEKAGVAEDLPTMTMEAYQTLDEQGNAGDTTLVVFDVYAPGAEEGAEPATVGDVLVQGDAVTVNLQFVSAQNTQLSVNYLPDGEQGHEVRVDVYAPNDMYFGCDARFAMGDVIVSDADIFVLDTEKPLFSEHGEIVQGGELTLSVDAEGKTAVAIEDLMGEDSQEAIQSLSGDLMGNGLGGIISAALDAMPEEVSALAGLLMGGGEAQETDEATEEAPVEAAEEAAEEAPAA